MNSEQLQNWLTEISEKFRGYEEKITQQKISTPNYQRRLEEIGVETQYLISYLMNNYENVQLIQPIIAQILSIYFKLGIGRFFVLQLIPSLMHTYLLGIAKRQKQSISMLETFFMAVYNEEILAGGPSCEQMTKKIEEIRIPSIRYPSIYHDPSKFNPYPEITQMRPNGGTTVQNIVRIGPFSAVDRINAENRAVVLTRILKSVNEALCYMCRDIVCRSYCISMLILAKGGFSYPESGFRVKVLQNKASDEDYGDQSKKPRIPLTSFFLMEALNGIHYSIFNGYADIGLRALDAVHNRAQYELYGDVLLITNALHDSLQQNQSIRMMLEIEPGILRQQKKTAAET
jgi:hypothetical protein